MDRELEQLYLKYRELEAQWKAKKLFGSMYENECVELLEEMEQIEFKYPNVRNHRYPLWLREAIADTER